MQEPEPEDGPFEYLALELIDRAPPDVAARLLRALHAPQVPCGQDASVQVDVQKPEWSAFGRLPCMGLLLVVLATTAGFAVGRSAGGECIYISGLRVPVAAPRGAAHHMAAAARHRQWWRQERRLRRMRKELATSRITTSRAAVADNGGTCREGFRSAEAQAAELVALLVQARRFTAGEDVSSAAVLAAAGLRDRAAFASLPPRSSSTAEAPAVPFTHVGTLQPVVADAELPTVSVDPRCLQRRHDGSCAEWIL